MSQQNFFMPGKKVDDEFKLLKEQKTGKNSTYMNINNTL